jgi:glyceraldehyde 3-phosphate dehydrogenase
VITSTGAATAAAKALPQLDGKLTGSAIRVPTPNVSLAIMHLQLGRETTTEALNDHFRQQALDSALSRQIGVSTSPETVSSDLVGSPYAGVVDTVATIVRGSRAVLYVWYDNEYGYSCQVVRLLQHMAGLTPRRFPPLR